MQGIWDTLKRPTLRIMGVEGEELQTKGIDNLFNGITAENFPNLEKKRVTQVQEAFRIPNYQDQNKTSPNTS
jgi:hypothetical protein